MDSTAGTSAGEGHGSSAQAYSGTYAALKALGKALQLQDGGLKLLATKSGALEALVDKLRSDPAKEAIRELLAVVIALKESREKVTRAFNATVEQVNADKEGVVAAAGIKGKTSEPPRVTADAETQSPCWWDSDSPPLRRSGQAPMVKDAVTADVPSSIQPSSAWTEVLKKGRKPKPPPLQAEVAGKQKMTKPRVRARPPAILVDVKSDEFPAIAKKIRGGVDQAVIGDSIVGMRQAKSGGLIIEVRGDQTRIEEVRAEISKSAGTEVDVRSLQQKVLVEVLDIDQWTVPVEVLEAISIATSTGQAEVKVVSLRKRYGGSQSALVSLPPVAARNLISGGRLRLGMVSCRVRPADPKVRCFRCLTYGHMSNACQGPDRRECCRRCGGVGHKAASCDASAQAAMDFARTVGCRRCGCEGHLAKDCKAEVAEATAFRTMLEKESMEARTGTGESKESSFGRDL